MYIHQVDVKTIFINGELDEEIYMELPKSFIVEGQKQKFCKIVKSLHELKQAPKQWHKKINRIMLSYGF